MGYVVLKKFYDRFDNMKLNKEGDEHFPPSDERALQLISQGFITAVENTDDDERIKWLGGGYYELPNGEKVRGKENALAALQELDQATENEKDQVKDNEKPEGDKGE